MKERGISQKEFSRMTGIAESTICDWKRKGFNPSSGKISHL
ncbi:helix-turn-helix domain-containing protein [Butyrivibrio sp. FCS014]